MRPADDHYGKPWCVMGKEGGGSPCNSRPYGAVMRPVLYYYDQERRSSSGLLHGDPRAAT